MPLHCSSWKVQQNRQFRPKINEFHNEKLFFKLSGGKIFNDALFDTLFNEIMAQKMKKMVPFHLWNTPINISVSVTY